MSMFKKSQRIWIPGLDQVQGIVLCAHDHLLNGWSYTIWWTDNQTLLPQEKTVTEAVLAEAQGVSGAQVASAPVVIRAAEAYVPRVAESITSRWGMPDPKVVEKFMKKLKKKNKKRSRKKSKSKR